MRTYRGTRRSDQGCEVTVDGRPLDARLDLGVHSPSGFEWAYGRGAAQLAIALLADHLAPEGRPRPDMRALAMYQRFRALVVAHMPFEGWTLTSEELRAVVALLERLS